MPGRGNSRGRGRGQNFRNQGVSNASVRDRLGKPIPNYPSTISTKGKYKFVRDGRSIQRVETTSLASLPGDNRIKSICRKFLRSYYEAFDKEGRANLESHYSADAFFSLSSAIPGSAIGRNLLRLPKESWNAQLNFGRANIAGFFLANFPPTEHLIEHLTMDIPFYIANPMSVISVHIVVTGVFKDSSEAINPLKAFSRVFILKLVSIDAQGEPVYQIFNDIFMLQPPTPDQIKNYHRDAQIMASRNSNNQDKSSIPTASGSNKTEHAMVQSIMSKTKMNKEASTQLLADFKWNEAEAMANFVELQKIGKIPQNFFI